MHACRWHWILDFDSADIMNYVEKKEAKPKPKKNLNQAMEAEMYFPFLFYPNQIENLVWIK